MELDFTQENPYFKRIDQQGRLDFSYLNHLIPYSGDNKEYLSNIDLEKEIEKLNAEIQSIDIRSIPFDKWDYIIAFSLAILEVAGDFLISDHNQKGSLANQMSDKNSKLGEYFNGLHEKLDHKGQPLDYQGYKFGGGDHRGRTFGHDLLMFPLAIYMLCSGKFIDGYYKDDVFQLVISRLNQYGNEYQGLSLDEALIAYFTHMIADFFSAKSLPIPGFSLLTHFPNRDIRKFACDLYKDGLNMRNLAMQGVPVATTELLMWIYTSLKYHNSDYSKEAIKNKKEKMLLISHGIATAVNIGKVVITKNPTSLNLVMIIRTIQLIWKVIKNEVDLRQKSLEKVNLTILKNKLETMESLILLDEAIYYTKQIDHLIVDMNKNFSKKNEERNETITEGFHELDDMLKKLKSLND